MVVATAGAGWIGNTGLVVVATAGAGWIGNAGAGWPGNVCASRA
jgi:hypothetical protein